MPYALPTAAVAACALLGAGCLPDYGEAPFACVKSQVCPEGYRCVDGLCRRGRLRRGRGFGRWGRAGITGPSSRVSGE